MIQKERKESPGGVPSRRPWGYYIVLEQGTGFKVKRIVVLPGQRLSLQYHCHRSEHWVVVKGAANIVKGDAHQILFENESIYIPKETLHRLENMGSEPLEVIEVQVGSYLEEDDIVRVDDMYGRTNTKSRL